MTRNTNKMLQRADWHDYHSPCIYMITLSKNTGIPFFSKIIKEGTSEKAKASVQLTDTGTSIVAQINPWLNEFQVLKVITMCPMPDHLHILLYVTERTAHHLSHFIKVLKLNCNRTLNLGCPVFESGYNDKIVIRRGQKDAFYRYIIDNPRRYLARKLFPGYFERVRCLVIHGQKMSLYGNLFLLNNPAKEVVRFSRKFSPKELEQRERIYDEAIRSGGVLVSPFIHPNEKEIKRRAISDGGSVIQILLNGFSDKFKPSGEDFELCVQGRLLLVAPTDYHTKKVQLIREMAVNANKLAEFVAKLDSDAI